jgi:hypothetical protein
LRTELRFELGISQVKIEKKNKTEKKKRRKLELGPSSLIIGPRYSLLCVAQLLIIPQPTYFTLLPSIPAPTLAKALASNVD